MKSNMSKLTEWYKPSKDTLLGHGCLKNHVTKELCVFGKFGEIWNRGETLRLVVRSAQKNGLVAKLLGQAPKSVLKGDEAQYTPPPISSLKLRRSSGSPPKQVDK